MKRGSVNSSIESVAQTDNHLVNPPPEVRDAVPHVEGGGTQRWNCERSGLQGPVLYGGVPRTIQDLEHITDHNRDYLFSIRWPNGFKCPRCGHNAKWKTNRETYRCQQCSFEMSILSCTGLQDCRLKLQEVLRGIWYVAEENVYSASELMKKLSVTELTARSLLHRLIYIITHSDVEPFSGDVACGLIKSKIETRGSRGIRVCKSQEILVLTEVEPGKTGLIVTAYSPDLSVEQFITRHITQASSLRTTGDPSFAMQMQDRIQGAKYQVSLRPLIEMRYQEFENWNRRVFKKMWLPYIDGRARIFLFQGRTDGLPGSRFTKLLRLALTTTKKHLKRYELLKDACYVV